MAKTCDICGKGPSSGCSIARRGLAKKKGGVGKNITGVTLRRFLPNLQSVKVKLDNGGIKRIRACTSCIKSGFVKKAN
ncbi:MAG: 50S ribosomal protein L28 [Candidatus Auribacterota bacterium]|jgi:large subunit ribosomal protein L28|uniref:Large ribosomal subunit protein bL28 n=1 Tax=Candidatus Auribacter fodinae TaxID=2093366 RepID=A0A3A4R1K9_9BACT|nr:MAG: 50S ribosomal protein L28 [Candidatus Auribacter fodinae]